MHRTHRQDDRDRRGGVVVSSMCRMFAGFALTTLLGCGDNTTVAACFGDAVFCHLSFNPRAIPGPDQTVAAGDIVTLDGSNSEPSGGIQSYSWTQTGGPSVALADANNATRVIRGALRDQRRNPVVPAYRRESNESGRQRFDPHHGTAGRNGGGRNGACVVPRIVAAGLTGRIDERLSIGNIRIDGGRRDRATRRVVGRALPGDREGHRRAKTRAHFSTRRASWSPQMMGR